MGTKAYSFRELLREALRHDPSMWKEDELNLSAVAKLYSRKGHPVSQASLHRLCNGHQDPGERVVEATHFVFGIPKYMVRGEPVSSEMDELLTRYRLSTLLLAKKLEALPREVYESIAQQIDVLTEQQEHIKRTQSDSKVVSFDKNRR